MEPYEILINLSKSEKAKCFEAILESIKLASDDSDDPGKHASKNLSFSTILGNYQNGHEISSEGSPRKKQKTLDSWLIKPVASHKNEIGETSRTSDVILSSDTNTVSECLDSTQSKLNSLNDENSLSLSKENCSKSVECLPDKFNKVVPISQPKIIESACTNTKKASLRSKRKCTESSQLSTAKDSTKCSISVENISLSKTSSVVTQLTNNCDANRDVSPENVSKHSNNATLEETSDVILNSDTNNVSECLFTTQSKLNNSGDENSLSSSLQNVKHSPCKSDEICNKFVRGRQNSQPEVSESTSIVTRKGNISSKRKHTEPSQLFKQKISTKSSIFSDNISLNKSNSVRTQSHEANNHDACLENFVSEHNSNVAFKRSSDVTLSSNTNHVSECSVYSQSNNLNDEKSLSSSKMYENSSQSVEHLPCKFDKVCNSFAKDSQPEVNKSTRIVTRTRSKRKYTEPSQLSKPGNSTKSSDNVTLNKSNTIITESHNITNNCDVSPDTTKTVFELASKNDCQEVDSLILLNKGIRNLRSRKVAINLPSIPKSSTKLEQIAAKKLDINKKTLSPEKNNSIDSSLLSNWEAFHILETECSHMNINLEDILQDETVKNILHNSDRLNNDKVFLINSFKSNNEKILPVVHLLESWKNLSGKLQKLKQSI